MQQAYQTTDQDISQQEQIEATKQRKAANAKEKRQAKQQREADNREQSKAANDSNKQLPALNQGAKEQSNTAANDSNFSAANDSQYHDFTKSDQYAKLEAEYEESLRNAIKSINGIGDHWSEAELNTVKIDKLTEIYEKEAKKLFPENTKLMQRFNASINKHINQSNNMLTSGAWKLLGSSVDGMSSLLSSTVDKLAEEEPIFKVMKNVGGFIGNQLEKYQKNKIERDRDEFVKKSLAASSSNDNSLSGSKDSSFTTEVKKHREAERQSNKRAPIKKKTDLSKIEKKLDKIYEHMQLSSLINLLMSGGGIFTKILSSLGAMLAALGGIKTALSSGFKTVVSALLGKKAKDVLSDIDFPDSDKNNKDNKNNKKTSKTNTKVSSSKKPSMFSRVKSFGGQIVDGATALASKGKDFAGKGVDFVKEKGAKIAQSGAGKFVKRKLAQTAAVAALGTAVASPIGGVILSIGSLLMTLLEVAEMLGISDQIKSQIMGESDDKKNDLASQDKKQDSLSNIKETTSKLSPVNSEIPLETDLEQATTQAKQAEQAQAAKATIEATAQAQKEGKLASNSNNISAPTVINNNNTNIGGSRGFNFDNRAYMSDYDRGTHLHR